MHTQAEVEKMKWKEAGLHCSVGPLYPRMSFEILEIFMRYDIHNLKSIVLTSVQKEVNIWRK